jgi:hypothetical protein
MSLGARQGALRLHGRPAPAAGTLWMAPNLMLQKWPAPAFTASAALDSSGAAPGQSEGLIVFGQDCAWIGMAKGATGQRFVMAVAKDARSGSVEREVASHDSWGPRLYLRVTVQPGGRCRFSASADNLQFTPLGEEFVARPGVWVGAKVGLFASAPPGAAAAGHADWDW